MFELSYMGIRERWCIKDVGKRVSQSIQLPFSSESTDCLYVIPY